MILNKQTIKPGVYHKGKDAFIVKDEDVKEMFESVNRIKEAGYRIPLWMEHPAVTDRLSKPIPKADVTLNEEVEGDPYFQGWVVGGDMEGDILNLKIDVDDKLGEKLAKKGTFVSPQFGKWEHGDTKIGKAIHHLAITRNPVNRSQSAEFKPIHQMSLTDVTEPVRFSLIDIQETTEKPIDESKANDGNSDQQLSNGDSVTPVDDKPQVTQASTDLIAKLKEAMKAMGIDVADDSPILKDVDAMAKVLGLLSQNMAGASKNIPDQTPPNEQATVIAMSTEPEKKIETPTAENEKVVQMSAALVMQKNIIDKLLVEATNSRKKDYTARINNLVKTGRCKKEKADTFLVEIGTYQFSVENSGPSTLDMKLELLEELPEGAVLSPTEKINQFSINETPVNTSSPFFTGGEDVSDERIAEIMKDLYPVHKAN